MLNESYRGRDGWQRVNRENPCPICEHPDWCTRSADGAVACCMRVESATRLHNGGYLHRLRDRDDRERHRHGVMRALTDFARRSSKSRTPPVRIKSQAPDLGALAGRCATAVSTSALATFARELGVSLSSLRRLGVGWSAAHSAWTFPMRDADGRVTGIRLRFPDGSKLSVCGGREGLFIPDGTPGPGSPWPDGAQLYVAEGASDCAALLTLGLYAVGRPSCSGGTRFILELARGRPVVVIADADPPGQRGANALGEVLKLQSPEVRIIRPPEGIKDVREWVRRGATRAEVERAVALAAPIPRWSPRAVALLKGGAE